MKFALPFTLIALSLITVAHGQAPPNNVIPVTPDTFVRAESDLYFSAVALKNGAFGKLYFKRDVSPIDQQFAATHHHQEASQHTLRDVCFPHSGRPQRSQRPATGACPARRRQGRATRRPLHVSGAEMGPGEPEEDTRCAVGAGDDSQ